MKKLVSLFMVCAIVLGLGAPLSAATDMEKPPLSEQSDDEILAFLEEYGIERIGQSVKWSDESMAGFAREVIEETEQYGYYTVTRGDTTYWDLGDAIEAATKEYYEAHDNPNLLKEAGMLRRAGMLEDSMVDGEYTTSMAKYNCYAYALDKKDGKYNPGHFSNGSINYDEMDSRDVAGLIKGDLQSSTFNMKCVKITKTIPDGASLVRGQKAICVRLGQGCLSDNQDVRDFHLMRYFPSEDLWRHKPGTTCILIYTANGGKPTGSLKWTNEAISNVPHPITIHYTGEIQFILYKSSHYTTSSGAYTGNNYHSGSRHYCEYRYTCKDCGDSYTEWTSYACSGNPCILPQSIGDEYVES